MTDIVERVARAMLEEAPSSFWAIDDLKLMSRAAIRVVLEDAASYIDGKGGEVIPGASVFAPLVS